MAEATDTAGSSESVGELAKALRAAQAEMRNPPKDSVNPHFKSRYADLATVRDAVIPVLNKHGLSVVQLPCELASGPALRTLLLHESGEWVGSTMLLRPTKNDPQGVGSALTYCRRYALQSLAGVAADDDDDGNAGARPAQQSKAPEPKPAPAPQTQQQPAQPKPAAKLGEGNKVADLSALIGRVADMKKLDPMQVWNRLLEVRGWGEVPTYDDLRADQLKIACDNLRATLKQSN